MIIIEIRVEVTGDLHNYYVELTQKGVNVEATEISLEKLVFTKIYLNPSNLDEAFLLNIANYYLDEQAVYYIGNIPSNVGIAKIQLINSPLNLNGYKLKNELGAKNLSGATRIDTNYGSLVEFYLIPNTTVSGSVYIEPYYYYKKLSKYAVTSSLVSVTIPSTTIMQGHINTINIYTARKVTLNLNKPIPDGQKVFYFNLDYFGFGRYSTSPLEKMSMPYTPPEYGVVSGNSVTINDLDLGDYWFFPDIYKKPVDKSSFTFGSRVDVKPSVKREFQINTNVVIKDPATKLDIRDLVTFTSQTNGSYFERYLTSMMLGSIQDIFIAH
ncbi:hypothetical protein [Paenibacillus sp. GP183]|uniref:hypothetical protein n=1 Tax=Paenibacillus sp. GP183 TaxID=1882751 RepID=UPI0011152762|nr:hypothetical protein [Paenibacillus sp. GP183]